MGPGAFKATLSSTSLLRVKGWCLRKVRACGPLLGDCEQLPPPSPQLSSSSLSSPPLQCQSLAPAPRWACRPNISRLSPGILGLSVNWKTLSLHSLTLHFSIVQTSIILSLLAFFFWEHNPSFHVWKQPFLLFMLGTQCSQAFQVNLPDLSTRAHPPGPLGGLLPLLGNASIPLTELQ